MSSPAALPQDGRNERRKTVSVNIIGNCIVCVARDKTRSDMRKMVIKRCKVMVVRSIFDWFLRNCGISKHVRGQFYYRAFAVYGIKALSPAITRCFLGFAHTPITLMIQTMWRIYLLVAKDERGLHLIKPTHSPGPLSLVGNRWLSR